MGNRKSADAPSGGTVLRPSWHLDVISPFALHRSALAATLSDSDAFSSVATHAEVAVMAERTYDVTIVDLPALGMTAVHDVVRSRPTVAWGGYLHTGTVSELVEAGLRGYVSVIGAPQDLVVAAIRVASGELSLPELSASVVRLTPAERRVCRAYLVDLAEAPRALVAAELGISERTLKAHLANIRAKVNSSAANRVELARQLRARGMLTG